MKPKIKRISEAYSMQPYYKEVDSNINYDFELKGIAEIKLKGDFYVGYDHEGNEIFAYRADAVNIEYFKPGEYVKPDLSKIKDDLPI